MTTERPVDRLAAGLAEGMAYCTVLFEPDFTIAWISPVVRELGGWDPADLVGVSALDLVHPDDIEQIAAIILAEQQAPRPFGTDPANLATNQVRVRTAGGSWRTFELAANNQTDNPACRGIVVVLRDITETGLQAEVLRRLAVGAPLPDVLTALVDLLAWQITGSSVRITASSARGHLVRAASPGTPRGRPALSVPVASARQPATVQVWLPTPDEPTQWCRTLVDRAAELVHVALVRDVGETELRDAARTDALTGVANHAGLAAHLADLGSSGWRGTHAVIYVDLDDFKAVNDDFGHAAGDAVLVEAARRLRSSVRPTDLVARPGGDEFVVVCASLDSPAVAESVARRILALLAAPFALAGGTVSCGASVGLACTDDGVDTAALLARADAALLEAKRAGKQRVGRWSAPSA